VNNLTDGSTIAKYTTGIPKGRVARRSITPTRGWTRVATMSTVEPSGSTSYCRTGREGPTSIGILQ
jgi:hypothetical protein